MKDCEQLEKRVKDLERELWNVHYQAAATWGATSEKAREYADKRIKEFKRPLTGAE